LLIKRYLKWILKILAILVVTAFVFISLSRIVHAMNKPIPQREWPRTTNPFEQKKAEAIR